MLSFYIFIELIESVGKAKSSKVMLMTRLVFRKVW